MKKFIFKILIFFTIITLLCLLNYSINNYYIKHNIPTIKSATLAMGDSHIKCSINPKYFNDLENLGHPGESYFLSFKKLKLINNNQPNLIKRIIIGLGHHTFSGYRDVRFSDAHHAKAQFDLYYALLSYKEFSALPMDKKKYIKSIIQNMLLFPRKKHHNFMGGYKGKKSNLNYADLNRKKIYFDEAEKKYGFSNNEIQYLDSIIYYCKKNDIELICLNTPVHKDYLDITPESYINIYEETKSKLTSQNIQLIEMQNKTLPIEGYFDHDHLSKFGADSTSIWLNSILNQ